MTKTRTHDCRVMLERLSAYLDGDLPAGQCRTIERHARGCARCTRVIEELRHTSGLCREAGSRPLPAPVRARAVERIRRLIAASARR